MQAFQLEEFNLNVGIMWHAVLAVSTVGGGETIWTCDNCGHFNYKNNSNTH